MKAIRILVPVLLLFSALGLFAAGCSEQPGDGFAIYLTGRDPGQSPPPATPEITGTPVISIGDIKSYDRNHHTLTLTKAAINRVAYLEVPVTGLEFAVCVNKQVIYVGAFWTPISSLSYDGPAILKPYAGQDSMTITIELGYPSISSFTGTDPRSDPRIFSGLAGRIVG